MKDIEKLLEECSALRAEAFDFAIAHGGNSWDTSNQLTMYEGLLVFLLDEDDTRSLAEWLVNPRADRAQICP